MERIRDLFGYLPSDLAADRGYGDKASVDALSKLGIDRVAVLRKGKPGPERLAFEKSPPVQALVKWRSGGEARISTMKRRWGWSRTRLANLDGAGIWCGWGVFCHNVHKIGLLIADFET